MVELLFELRDQPKIAATAAQHSVDICIHAFAAVSESITATSGASQTALVNATIIDLHKLLTQQTGLIQSQGSSNCKC